MSAVPKAVLLASELEAHAGHLSAGSDNGITKNMRAAANELRRMHTLINTPHTEVFLQGVMQEGAHQVDRWGYAHDRQKSAENWFWLVGYLAGKALRAAITGDREKALHHCISSAAALMHWHDAIAHDESGTGAGRDVDLEALEAGPRQAHETAPVNQVLSGCAVRAELQREETQRIQMPPQCTKSELCVLADGHTGDCDDLPF